MYLIHMMQHFNNFFSPLAATQNAQHAGSVEYYTPHGDAFIDSRETNTADMLTIAQNLVNQWRHKRKVIDIFTYGGGMAEAKVGDLVTVILEGLDIPTPGTEFQIISKAGSWGERFPTRANILHFRLCEYIDANTPSMWYVGLRESVSNLDLKAGEALGQHA